MKREFIYLPPFEKNWAAYGLTDEELEQLEVLIMTKPDAAKIIQGTGGLRKLRFPLPGKGKSGGARVLYVDFVTYEKTFMVNVYIKSDKETVSDREKQQYKQVIEEIAKALKEEK